MRGGGGPAPGARVVSSRPRVAPHPPPPDQVGGSPTSPFQGEVLWSLLRGCVRKGRRYSAGLVAALAASRALSAAAFFSTPRTDQIEASYSANNGTASESWLSTSGGVRTAAIMNAPTTK